MPYYLYEPVCVLVLGKEQKVRERERENKWKKYGNQKKAKVQPSSLGWFDCPWSQDCAWLHSGIIITRFWLQLYLWVPSTSVFLIPTCLAKLFNIENCDSRGLFVDCLSCKTVYLTMPSVSNTLYTSWVCIYSMVVKINFHIGKNHFFSPVSGTNFRAGYACRGNAHIWLVGTRGRTSFLRWQKWNSSVETTVKEWLRACASIHHKELFIFFWLMTGIYGWSSITIQQLERFPKLFRISSWDTLHKHKTVFALQSWDTLLCGFLYLSLRLGVSPDLYLKLL